MSARAAVLALAHLGLLACGNVVQVLSGPPPSGAAGTAAGGSSGAAGGSSAEGGAEPEDRSLGAQVDSGNAHSCAARFGILYCWGANADGRLGVGDEQDRLAPARVGRDADWVSVASGVAHTCALKRDGGVWCFGENKFGQLGQGNLQASSRPLRVALPQAAQQLSSEANTVCVVLEDGELWCWGANSEGNIGLDDPFPGADQQLPVRSGGDADWLHVATGDGHTCAVRGAGVLYGWGRNSTANLGLGQTVDQQRRAATPIGTEQDWTRVASGQDSSCGLRGGALFCWGGNTFGNLGLGDRELRLAPTALPAPAGSSTWTQVSVDTFHACAVDGDSNLHCWGRNLEGQLGSGDNDDRLSPEAMGSGYSQVAVGRFSTCAVTSDARVACSGENGAGQLGVGDTVRRNAFTEVVFP